MKHQKFISSLLFFLSLSLLLPTITTMSSEEIKNYSYFSAKSHNTNIKDQILMPHPSVTSSPTKKPQQLYAKAYCLIDGHSGRILLGHHENKKLPMASTTKIMTCLIALENANLTQTVTASSYAASMPDVQLNMVTGEKFRLKDLLYSLMLESHNDTAVAIAEQVGGSVKGFANLMNEKALSIGCRHTHFVTPNGLDDRKHYTTAADLCRIAMYAMKNPTFRKIIQTKSYTFSSLNKSRSFSVNNHDAFLSSYPGALGIKTGFTGNAGYCFCGAAKKGKNYLISTVLACGWPPHRSYKWSDTKQLMDYGFQNYQLVTVPIPKKTIPCPVSNGLSSYVIVQPGHSENISCMMRAKDSIRITTKIFKDIKAPIRSGDILGYQKYTLGKQQITKIPLIAKSNIPALHKKHIKELLISCFFWRKSSYFCK